MAPKRDQEQKHKAAPGLSPAQGDQNLDLEEYGPIFFHNENEDYGFMSNFYRTTFGAPHPSKWLSQLSETVPSAVPSQAGDEGPDTVVFRHSEQYYMYCKAIYFGDEDAASKIINADTPTECKAAGRSVRGYSDKAWEKHDLKVRVMEEALWWKFGGGKPEGLLENSGARPEWATINTKEDRMKSLNDLGRELLATGERQLVEAAGRDRYWGIGYKIKQGPHLFENSWGRNQLGKSLMAVRERLRELVDGDTEEMEVE
ncbi:hypothetical protein SLS64_005663 [Diaporthe eres]|uniref:NADAR domain-containing protein n=1 Tax=Diaporthe eres TaxID=83184 RepID=A0ABR1NTN8_DIAER